MEQMPSKREWGRTLQKEASSTHMNTAMEMEVAKKTLSPASKSADLLQRETFARIEWFFVV